MCVSPVPTSTATALPALSILPTMKAIALLVLKALFPLTNDTAQLGPVQTLTTVQLSMPLIALSVMSVPVDTSGTPLLKLVIPVLLLMLPAQVVPLHLAVQVAPRPRFRRSMDSLAWFLQLIVRQ